MNVSQPPAYAAAWLLSMLICGSRVHSAPSVSVTPLSNSQCGTEQVQARLQLSTAVENRDDRLILEFGNLTFQTNLAENVTEIIMRCNLDLKLQNEAHDRWVIRSGIFSYELSAPANVQGYYSVRLQSPRQTSPALVKNLQPGDGRLFEERLPFDAEVKPQCENASERFVFRSKIFGDVEESSPGINLSMNFKRAEFTLTRVSCP